MALKIVSPELLADPVARLRFEREPKLHVAHPNIVQIYDAGKVDGTPFFAMQFVEGKSLSRILAESGRLGADQLVPVINGVASALDAIHKQGIIHRDVKPSNVLVHASMGVKHAFLTDFGVAALTRDQGPATTSSARAAGTPRYMSPEQAKRQPATPLSDIYSLGVMAYEALTGRPPFDGSSDTRIMEMHLRNTPPAIQAINPMVPVNVANVVMRALSKEPSQRFASAGEFARTYEQAVAASGLGNRKLRRMLAAVLAILVVLVAGAVIAIIISRDPVVSGRAAREKATAAAAMAITQQAWPPKG